MIDDDKLSQLVREALPPMRAPDSLRAWAAEQARSGTPEPRRSNASRWHRVLYAAGLIVAATLGFATRDALLHRPDAHTDAIAAQLVDEHVQSLMANHLMDVVSTDQHTVKPWFAGRVDFAPRVLALDSVGFPLIGGRVAYVDGHQAAAVVYGRRKHFINLFEWREPGRDATPSAHAISGYSLLDWREGGVRYWAVSDAAPAELRAFQAAFAAP